MKFSQTPLLVMLKYLAHTLKLFSITIVANVAYVIYLFRQPKTPFFEYQTEVSGGNFIIFDRGEKILENLEILFTWNQYFQLDLFHHSDLTICI